MPRIPDSILNSVFYLYPSVEDAQNGHNAGGTGFIGSLRLNADPDLSFYYAISNWHVACRGSSVARIMRRDGGSDILPFGPEDWFFDPNGSDVAVTPLPLSLDVHRAALLPLDGPFQVTRGQTPIGLGDDVFMIGRFVDHDGGDVNLPTARFGNISMMPTPVLQENGKKRLAYCIDMHSRSGYSGSPVFVFRTPGSDMSKDPTKDGPKVVMTGETFFLPLGIHIGQFPEIWKIKGRKVRALPAEGVELPAHEQQIEGVSGMTCVVPMEVVRALLEIPALKKMRDQVEEEFARRKPTATAPKAEAAESAPPTTPEGDDQHRERFTALLDAVVQKPKRDD